MTLEYIYKSFCVILKIWRNWLEQFLLHGLTIKKCDVMFLWNNIDTKDILRQLPFDPAIEDVTYLPGAALWRIDRDKASKSRMFKIVGTKLHQQMTVRNSNTVRKIYELMSRDPSNG